MIKKLKQAMAWVDQTVSSLSHQAVAVAVLGLLTVGIMIGSQWGSLMDLNVIIALATAIAAGAAWRSAVVAQKTAEEQRRETTIAQYHRHLERFHQVLADLEKEWDIIILRKDELYRNIFPKNQEGKPVEWHTSPAAGKPDNWLAHCCRTQNTFLKRLDDLGPDGSLGNLYQSPKDRDEALAKWLWDSHGHVAEIDCLHFYPRSPLNHIYEHRRPASEFYPPVATNITLDNPIWHMEVRHSIILRLMSFAEERRYGLLTSPMIRADVQNDMARALSSFSQSEIIRFDSNYPK